MRGSEGGGYTTDPPNRTDTQYKLTVPTRNTSLLYRHSIQAYRTDTTPSPESTRDPPTQPPFLNLRLWAITDFLKKFETRQIVDIS